MSTLNKRDLLDPVWLKHLEDLKERLQYLRQQNDIDHSPEETAKLRGRIAEIKAHFALSNPSTEET
jgi:ribosomal protein L29